MLYGADNSPCRKNDDISLQYAPIAKFDASCREPSNGGTTSHFDIPVYYLTAGTSVCQIVSHLQRGLEITDQRITPHPFRIPIARSPLRPGQGMSESQLSLSHQGVL